MEPGPPHDEQAALQALVDGLVWRACRPQYAARVGPHEYVVRGRTISEDDWQVLGDAIQRYGTWQRYLVTGSTFRYLVLGEHRYWLIAGLGAGRVLNRALEADVADKYGPPPGAPRKRSKGLRLSGGGRQVIDQDSGILHDVQAIIERLPWRHSVVTPPPCMPPHSYVMLGSCDEDDWKLLAFVIRAHPDSYLAYFRGYQHPMRYLEIEDRRYWRSSLNGKQFLNWCTLDSVEPPRRVDHGAEPRLEWDALHPWWPKGYWAPHDALPGTAERNRERAKAARGTDVSPLPLREMAPEGGRNVNMAPPPQVPCIAAHAPENGGATMAVQPRSGVGTTPSTLGLTRAGRRYDGPSTDGPKRKMGAIKMNPDTDQVPRLPRKRIRKRARGAGEGTIVERADGRWAAALTLPSGRRRWLYGKTRAEVAAKLNDAIRDAAEGRSWGDRRQSVEQYLHWWLVEQAKPTTRPATFRTYRMYVERHIIPRLGNLRLVRLSPQHVQQFMNEKLTSGLEPRTVLHIRAILRRALGQALKQGLVSRNAAQLVDPPRVEDYEIQPLTPEQARAFLDGIRGDRLEALYSVALALGLRRGEALGLTWSDINLEAGTLTVRRSLQRIDHELRFVELKTRKSRRTLALPRFALATLREHRMRQVEERVRFADVYQDQGFVFARPDGHALNEAGVTRALQDALKRLGLPHQRFHDLRHGAASLMRAQGADLKEISAALGHSEIGITADLYTHLFPEVSRDIADRMDALVERRP